jgi:CubicO group peptidase (beta-lactamase class C family)
MAAVGGFAAPGFEAVAHEFERNFEDRGELGAAFAACVDGEPVIDLWGGRAEPGADGRPWREDTLQLIFSGTKGLVATCLLMLVDRGLLDLDAPACTYWPEFAAQGKERITVAELASHRARLPGVAAPLDEADLADDRRMAGLLAGQAPEADPRAAATYHPLTYGWLCGELIRRVDGRSVGRFFAEEVAAPLELEVWIGLPAELEPRVTTLVTAEGWGAGPLNDPRALAQDELLRRIWANPPFLAAGELAWNTRAYHAAEIPGGGAIATARSLARLYGCLARGGELDGVRLLREETLVRGRRELSRFRDPFSDEPYACGVGYELQTEQAVFGPVPDAFGHTGAGGSVHGAWPRERVGFSYAMNEMRDDPVPDPRSQALLRALHDALRRAPLTHRASSDLMTG